MTAIELLKETMHRGMLENFKKDGYLTPIFFMLKGDQPVIVPILMKTMASPEKKEALSMSIKVTCKDPRVLCAGIIMEAYSRSFQNPNDELLKLLKNSNLRVSELKEKNEIIIMIFATPEKEEMISYLVSSKTKTIVQKIEGGTKISGIFGDFFSLR